MIQINTLLRKLPLLYTVLGAIEKRLRQTRVAMTGVRASINASLFSSASGGEMLRDVVGFAHVFLPSGSLPFGICPLHGQVDHDRVWRGAVPVALAGLKPDHVAGRQFHNALAGFLGTPKARHDLQ